MKELSIEEKAEAYDKSLERAKSVIEQNPLMEYLKKGIEYIFPELKESKVENVDEKVRKALIKLVTNHASMDLFIEYDIHLDEALAWLEKQGDKDKLIQELGEYKVKYTQEVLEKHLKIINKNDERLRKTTIAFLKDFAEQGYENAVECIDWLEKQGEKSSDKIVEKARTEKQRVLLTETDGSANIDWDCRSLQDVKLLLEYGLDYIKKLEKQSEQKPADKVEPKFKEGDWVVLNNDVCQIVKREEGCNQLVTQYGIQKELVNERNLSTARLWTIQDAKAGDVLACKGNIKYSNGIKYERICLFNNIDNAFFTLTKNSNSVEEYDIDVNIDYPDNTVPATKEQKEILFMVMKEAGLEWDAEKKELKKIADEEQIKKNLQDNSFRRMFEQKSVWGEEDEEIARALNDYVKNLDTLFSKINIGGKDVLSKEFREKVQDWLKSIKDRVQPQPKQEWNEEDEKVLHAIRNALNYEKPRNYLKSRDFEFTDILDWLKSLRPHSAWKPSEEMIEALGRTIPENVMEISEDEMLLGKLYQGLKYGRVLSEN